MTTSDGRTLALLITTVNAATNSNNIRGADVDLSRLVWVLVFTVNSLARSPEAMSAALSIGKRAQLKLVLSLERELEATPIHVGVVTVCGPIQARTAYDPDRRENVYWDLATQDPARLERDRLVQASN